MRVRVVQLFGKAAYDRYTMTTTAVIVFECDVLPSIDSQAIILNARSTNKLVKDRNIHKYLINHYALHPLCQHHRNTKYRYTFLPVFDNKISSTDIETISIVSCRLYQSSMPST